MFLGWLLDPQGSHGLKTFPIKRLLVAVSDPTIIGDNEELDKIMQYASLADLSEAKVWPNERNQKEYRYICNSEKVKENKLDVFIEIESEENDDKLIILLEQKVDSPIDKEQCSRYLSWLTSNFDKCFIIPIVLAPNDRYSISSEEIFGDRHWYGIDYQLLHDIILLPIIDHPSLNPQARILIEQYIDVLRIPDKGRKLAVTEEEKI